MNKTIRSIILGILARGLQQSGLPIRSEIKADATQMIKIINEDQSHIVRYCQNVINKSIHPG